MKWLKISWPKPNFNPLAGRINSPKSTTAQESDTLYHYTSRSGADTIAKEKKILEGTNGVLLIDMKPEWYYRHEILKNIHGDCVPPDFENRADYCVKVKCRKLSMEKLKKVDEFSDGSIYLYQGDIFVSQQDIVDKPKCNRKARESKSVVGSKEGIQENQQAGNSHAFENENMTSYIASITIGIRRGIDLNYSQTYQDGNVTIFSFEWLKEGLETIGKALDIEKVLLNVRDSVGNQIPTVIPFGMQWLQAVARNESSNTNGAINLRNYDGISDEIILSMKDLVRQTVIVGNDHTTHYGGYPKDCKRREQIDTVYVCDLIGLQFQQDYSTGRLVVVGENLPKGILDDFIYEHVVKEKKPTIEQARRDNRRFIKYNNNFFDSKAYIKFVANDVLITGLALNQCANHEPLNFKFLKYGTGYFAGIFREQLEKFIGQGVAEGLQELLQILPVGHSIKRIELPFFNKHHLINEVCRKFKVELKYSNDDSLKKSHKVYVTATTNCADPHAMTGNNMGFNSIDGAIAENLQGKAIKFSPIINKLMKEFYFNCDVVGSEEGIHRTHQARYSRSFENEIMVSLVSNSASNSPLNSVPNNVPNLALVSASITMNVRQGINLDYSQPHQDETVTIFSFEWLKSGLETIRNEIDIEKVLLNVRDSVGNEIPTDIPFGMKWLQAVARNESSNTNGAINRGNYDGISEEIILSIKDLVRQTVIVGKDHTTHYGGYPWECKRVEQKDTVYVCDLIGLQFQQNYNTGRLVIVGENLPKGILDDFIYEHVVKEKKPTIVQARSNKRRFIKCDDVFFDSQAYVKFVANDVLITGLALNQCAREPINFKFLKYGTGYFAGIFLEHLEKFIGQAVAEGLQELLQRLPVDHSIKSIELPFFNEHHLINEVCRNFNVELKYSHVDSLKKTHKVYVTATTNCANPHAMTGNSMGFNSIDSAIAENLQGKAIKFSPIINKLMKEYYFNFASSDQGIQRNHEADHSRSFENEIMAPTSASNNSLNSASITIGIRQGIDLDCLQKYQDGNVTIFSFEWLKNGLETIRKAIDIEKVLLNIRDSAGNQLPIDIPFGMKWLQAVARNESSNTNGVINSRNYDGISEDIIISMKDLVRQTVIVGKDHTTHYGGYPWEYKRVEQEDTVYVCDLIGLQFQQNYNTGRLVIVGENLPKGILDDFIYEHVVNEKKPTIEQARSDSSRFIKCNDVFFDSQAYVKFVANDVLIAGLALNHCATEPINFKFLKYWTENFRSQHEMFIGQGVAEGLEELLQTLPEGHNIKRIELPFFNQDHSIDKLCGQNNIKVKYSDDDSLKKTHEEYVTATTNCADSNAMTGSKVGISSIDSAIAENLEGKGIKFSPAINKLMKEFYF